MTIKEFTVDVSKWCRGGINGDPSLLNEEGFMCCLGFLSKACGIEEYEMTCIADPENLEDESLFDFLPKELLEFKKMDDEESTYPSNTLLCQDLIDINDSKEITDHDRMSKLKYKFESIGIDIKFVNTEEGK